MTKVPAIFLSFIICCMLLLGSASEAEAKRFGGGRSFGGRSAYSLPYKRSALPKRAPSARQQKASAQNQAARQGLSRRGGFMGMLGGLALGGLLGALFFGGAFEGINMMDILILGGIAFLLFKLFAAKAANTHKNSYQGGANYTQDIHSQSDSVQSQNQSTVDAAGFDTNGLFNKDSKRNSYIPESSDAEDATFMHKNLPAGFVQDDFLEGAKSAFRSLQNAWDKQELAEIRSLTTDKMFAEIKTQLQVLGQDNLTEILKLHAELLEVREYGPELQAVVLFDCIMRENINDKPDQVREIWHFYKQTRSIHPKWLLDGIQQIEH